MHLDLCVRYASRRQTDGRTVRFHKAVRREDAVDSSSCDSNLQVIHALCHIMATPVRSVLTRRRHLMYPSCSRATAAILHVSEGTVSGRGVKPRREPPRDGGIGQAVDAAYVTVRQTVRL
jgi:hypothetical protein